MIESSRLSESHNFGKFVYEKDGLIVKPRSVFWEQLFLTNSLYRTNINGLFLETSTPTPFQIWPNLKFSTLNQSESQVEKLEIEPLKELSADEGSLLGSSLAIVAWHGFTDINSENLFIGRMDKQFIFAPIDIESVGLDLDLLSESHLVPNRYVPEWKSGLGPYLEVIRGSGPETLAAILCGYLRTMLLLQKKEEVVDEMLASNLVDENPKIRVIVRKSQSYANYINGCAKPTEFEVPAFSSEKEQMDRGDIPYYFRFCDSPVIYHYSQPDKYEVSDVNDYPKGGRAKVLRQRKLIGDIERRESLGTLIDGGALQLSRSLLLDKKQLSGSYQECALSTDGEQIYLSFSKQKRLQCPLRPLEVS